MKKIGTSISLWESQTKMLHEVAAKGYGGNVSAYLREVVIPLVAKHEGVAVPATPERKLSTSGTWDIESIAEAVAARLGLGGGKRA